MIKVCFCNLSNGHSWHMLQCGPLMHQTSVLRQQPSLRTLYPPSQTREVNTEEQRERRRQEHNGGFHSWWWGPFTTFFAPNKELTIFRKRPFWKSSNHIMWKVINVLYRGPRQYLNQQHRALQAFIYRVRSCWDTSQIRELKEELADCWRLKDPLGLCSTKA